MGSKFSLDEAAAHMALWAILKSPMIISADLRRAIASCARTTGIICLLGKHISCVADQKALTLP